MQTCEGIPKVFYSAVKYSDTQRVNLAIETLNSVS